MGNRHGFNCLAVVPPAMNVSPPISVGVASSYGRLFWPGAQLFGKDPGFLVEEQLYLNTHTPENDRRGISILFPRAAQPHSEMRDL